MTGIRTVPAPWGRPFMAALVVACAQMIAPHADAQTPPPGFDSIPRPPGSIGPSQNLMPPGSSSGVLAPQTPASPLQLAPPSAQPVALPPAPPAPPPAATVTPSVPMVPAGQVALMVNARFGKEPPAITGGLHWRVYADRPDASGIFRLLREERAAAPIFVLPPGGYVVHVGFGLATAAKKVQLRSETVRETFELVAGGARFEGRVGDSRIPAGQITFDIFRGSQFEGEDKRPLASGVASTDVLLLPEGTYHVVSNYGDSNATVRSDIRVQAGKLTDVVVNHRAAVITLKLVNERGGEALANTQWSVLTPGGDVVKEATGAFPKVILAEGEYSVVARNEGKVYNGKFKVEPGFDREIEVLSR
ncbi:MAG: hypothetical protein E6G97_11065 [Alphaproteobacteria bacterium]|nr:MAG: hypothetical protein E6G97_11065 [Alphaproteobacteria bacterium]